MNDFSEEMLSAYLDGELSPEEMDRVEAALRDRPERRRLLADLQRLSDSLRSLPGGQPPQDVLGYVLTRAEREGVKPAAETPDKSVRPAQELEWPWRSVVTLALSAAAVVTLVLIVNRPEREVAQETAVGTASPADAPTDPPAMFGAPAEPQPTATPGGPPVEVAVTGDVKLPSAGANAPVPESFAFRAETAAGSVRKSGDPRDAIELAKQSPEPKPLLRANSASERESLVRLSRGPQDAVVDIDLTEESDRRFDVPREPAGSQTPHVVYWVVASAIPDLNQMNALLQSSGATVERLTWSDESETAAGFASPTADVAKMQQERRQAVAKSEGDVVAGAANSQRTLSRPTFDSARAVPALQQGLATRGSGEAIAKKGAADKQLADSSGEPAFLLTGTNAQVANALQWLRAGNSGSGSRFVFADLKDLALLENGLQDSPAPREKADRLAPTAANVVAKSAFQPPLLPAAPASPGSASPTPAPALAPAAAPSLPVASEATRLQRPSAGGEDAEAAQRLAAFRDEGVGSTRLRLLIVVRRAEAAPQK